jgi:hypothetical protein
MNMSLDYRRSILRLNASFLILASTGGLATDIAGSFFARGPEAILLAGSPGAGIGFIEAHGLALIFGVLLWRAASSRSWHLAAAAVHALLGTANLVFWQFFIDADVLAVGYVTTIAHWLLVAAQLVGAALVGHDDHANGTDARLLPQGRAI